MRRLLFTVCAAWIALAAPALAARADVFERVRHHTADSNGVPIHYVTLGRGPLLVMIHGFPDFWYGWRDQIDGLSRHYQVAAVDLRGYDLSGQPKGVEQYDMTLLANDIAAVIHDLGRDRATIIGHDWGGGVAWAVAMAYPALTERLIVLQTPHPRGMLRELRTNPQQLANSAYARFFQQEGAHTTLTPDVLTAWAVPADASATVRAHYLEAFGRSDAEAMLNYYKRNYPRAPYDDVAYPTVTAPTLIIHGLDDAFLLAAGHNSTWDFVSAPVTITTVPGVGHFIQQAMPTTVTKLIKEWLASTKTRGDR